MNDRLTHPIPHPSSHQQLSDQFCLGNSHSNECKSTVTFSHYGHILHPDGWSQKHTHVHTHTPLCTHGLSASSCHLIITNTVATNTLSSHYEPAVHKVLFPTWSHEFSLLRGRTHYSHFKNGKPRLKVKRLAHNHMAGGSRAGP